MEHADEYTDGNLSGYHKKKYVCKVRAPLYLHVPANIGIASLYLHSRMERRLWTPGSRQPNFCEQVFRETNRIPCDDSFPPRTARTVTSGSQ